MKPLKAGVIGLGVGSRHIASYHAIEGVAVAAICDLDGERLQEVGDLHGIGARYDDYRRVTEDPEIDVVSICSYDEAHAEQILSALRNGKHVMVEKPVVLFRRDLEAVARAQQDSGRYLTSNLILRESPRFKRLKRMIAEGEFGEVFYMEGDYIHEILWKITEGWRGKQSFYCVTYGGGIHLIDLMRWLIGDEVVEINGMGNDMRARGGTYEYPDTIVNLMRFEGGALAKTMTTFGPARPHFHALNVFGSRRCFVNDVPEAKLFEGSDDDDARTMSEPYPGYDKGDLLPDFIAAIRDRREPNVSARDVFRVMDICFAAWESVKAGRTCKVDYVV